MINFITCFHTQWEVFFQIKFHLGMKFYSFHPGMKLTCKQTFFHPGTSFIRGWDFILVTCKRTLRFCRYENSSRDERQGWKKEKKTCKHFIPGWNFKMSMFLIIFWRMYLNMLSKVHVFEHNESMNEWNISPKRKRMKATSKTSKK